MGSMTTPNEPQPTTQIQGESWLTAYQLIAARRSNSDTLRWQIPAFGVTAEAVLISAAIQVLLSDNPFWTAAMALGLGIGLLGIYISSLMYGHSRYERIDVLMLAEIEWHLLGGALGSNADQPPRLLEHREVLPFNRGGDRAKKYARLPEMRFREVFYWWSPQGAWALVIVVIALTAGIWILADSWTAAHREAPVGSIALLVGFFALALLPVARAFETAYDRRSSATSLDK